MLFSALQAFGVGEGFLTWVKLLSSGSCCVVNVGGGLSCPVAVRGLSAPELAQSNPVLVLAYAGSRIRETSRN